jgi:hypothetical protein
VSRGKTLDQFADVAAVLDAAMACGGALYSCPTNGAAIHWRQRAYTLRAMLRKLNAERTAPGVGISTKYDHVQIKIEDTVCRIEMLKPQGVLTDLKGRPIQVGIARNVAQDPMVDEAALLLRELGDDKDFDL